MQMAKRQRQKYKPIQSAMRCRQRQLPKGVVQKQSKGKWQ